MTTQLERACVMLRGLSDEVALWMQRQPNVGEETLTDFILYQASVREPWVRYRKFHHHEEARTFGADFDWWFVGRSISLGLRLQAKKVESKADHYPGLARENKHGLQVEKLLKSASEDNLIPLYALYYSGRPPDFRVMCKRPAEAPASEGLYISSALRVNDSFIAPGRKRVSAEALLAVSNPFRCLVCCSLVSGPAGPLGGLRRHFQTYFPEFSTTSGRAAADGVEEPGYHRRLPPHVTTLLEADQGQAPEWWDREFSALGERTGAVAVWDLRESEGG